VTIAKALTGESGTVAGVAEPGENLTYTITLTNTGGADVTGYALSDALPANTTFVRDGRRCVVGWRHQLDGPHGAEANRHDGRHEDSDRHRQGRHADSGRRDEHRQHRLPDRHDASGLSGQRSGVRGHADRIEPLGDEGAVRRASRPTASPSRASS
jgi:uncharacterized repeat protein (TIGR01451 family)